MVEIRRAIPEDAIGIISLVGKVFPNCGLVKYGYKKLANDLKNEKYVSFVACFGVEIVGHVGLHKQSDIAIHNGLVVDDKARNGSLGRQLISQVKNFAAQDNSINYETMYVSLHNRFVQRYLEESYKPIGMCVTSGAPFSTKDPLYENKLFHFEIALCKTKKRVESIIKIPNCGNLEYLIQTIYHNMGKSVIFENVCQPKFQNSYIDPTISIDVSKNLEQVELNYLLNHSNYKLLGVMPSFKDGLNGLGFTKIILPKISLLTTHGERENFVEQIMNQYL